MTRPLNRQQSELLAPYIVSLVGSTYGFSNDYLTKRSRKKNIIRCKHVCIFLLREYASALTLKRTAELFGLHHSIVIHAAKKIRNSTDPDIRLKIEELRIKIEARIKNILGSPVIETSDGFKYIDLNHFTSIRIDGKYLLGINLTPSDLDHLSMIFGDIKTRQHRDTGLFVFEKEGV